MKLRLKIPEGLTRTHLMWLLAFELTALALQVFATVMMDKDVWYVVVVTILFFWQISFATSAYAQRRVACDEKEWNCDGD